MPCGRKPSITPAIAALFVAAPVSAQGTGAVTQSDITRLQDSIYLADRDLSSLPRLLDEPTESMRQLEVWRETNSVLEVAKDVVQRTEGSVAWP